MRPSRPLTAISRPITAVQAVPPPVPLEAEMYRPRGTLAALLCLAPVLVALPLIFLTRAMLIPATATQIVLGVGGGILLVWLAAMVLASRVLFITVQASIEGIEARTLRDERILLRWKLIDDVSRQFGLLRLRSSDGRQVTLIESGLTNGQQLLRQILLRVSPTVLSPALQEELKVLGGDIMDPAATQRLPISRVWLAGAGVAALGGIGLIVGGVLLGALGLIILGGLLLSGGAAALVVMRQQILINSQEITLISPLGRPRTLLWSEIALIETLPLDLVMGLRGNGGQRLLFLGPFFLSPLRAEYLRSLVDAHLTEQGVMTYRRWRLG